MGCGALGCEYLKGLALMGLAAMFLSIFCGTGLTLMPGACSGPGGKLIVTDMDRIEA